MSTSTAPVAVHSSPRVSVLVRLRTYFADSPVRVLQTSLGLIWHHQGSGKTELMAEKLSVVMARRHLEAADVSLLMIDATEGVTASDATIGGYPPHMANMDQSYWATHLQVDDAEASAQKAKSLGGTIVVPTMPNPLFWANFSPSNPGPAHGFSPRGVLYTSTSSAQPSAR